MRITVDYGRTGLSIQVPDHNLKAILGLQPSAPLADPDAAIRASLETPIGAPAFRDVARGAETACILVCDITRPVPNERLLRPALELLEAGGMRPENILILVATGLHRASTPGELVEMLGPVIPERYRVESHDAIDTDAHVNLGLTSGGCPALVDRRYMQADLKISVGLIEPHLMAGFSGGRKVICPGIVAVETLRHFHGVAILESPLATAGQVAGNPVHALSLEIARMAGCDFILNTALDDNRQITAVFCGDLLQAWESGVEHVRSIASAPLAEPADIVITSAAGYPLDSTFYQAVKGLVGAAPAVKPGGAIIMVAALQEGVGSPEFKNLLASSDSVEALVRRIHTPGFFQIDQWQAQELAAVCEHARITVCSGEMPDSVLSKTLVASAPTPEAAIDMALEQYGPDASIAVIPRGPYVLPVVTGL